jgi:transcriptional regulator with XRE-family HTH domain
MTGEDLKAWRKKLRITQVELARLLGTYQVTIARWETGTRKIPFLLPLALEALEHRLTKFTKQDKEVG